MVMFIIIPNLQRYCGGGGGGGGEQLPRDFISSNNQLFIKLVTDSYVNKPGFLISYQTGKPFWTLFSNTTYLLMNYLYTGLISQLTSCATDTFTCSDGAACIPQYMVCDGKQECADGSDEESVFCGNFTACCPFLLVHYTYDVKSTYDKYPNFFTTYKIEEDKLNDRHHYSSTDGQYALSSACNNIYWLLQTDTDRCRINCALRWM